jgi:hypothetical protein
MKLRQIAHVGIVIADGGTVFAGLSIWALPTGVVITYSRYSKSVQVGAWWWGDSLE